MCLIWFVVVLLFSLLKAAETLYKTTCTKFKDSKKVWIQYGLFKLRCGDVEGARAVLQRSLKSLPKRKREPLDRCVLSSC